MKKLLVVVDMVNGFINEGALADKRINNIVPAIIRKIEQAKAEGATIVAFRDCHSENDEEFKTYPPHCIKGSFESELIDELKPYQKDMIDIEKNTTNGFNTKKMRQLLKENVFDSVDITGCCTDICVNAFASSMMKYIISNNLPTKLYISDNAVDTFSLPGHDGDEVNKSTLKELEEIGVNVEYRNSLFPIKVKKLTDRKYLNLFEVTYRTEEGEIKYEVVTRRELPEIIKPSINPDAVNILPYSYVNGKTLVYLIKEFRYAIGDYVYEIPAGLVDAGENPVESAKREVREELGASVLHIKRTESSAYSSIGMTDEKSELYEAEVVLDGKQDLQEGEDIEILPVELEQLESMLDKENFGARSKYALRNFVYREKIKSLEDKIKKLENGDVEKE